MSASDSAPSNPRRKALMTAVCAVALESGFSSAEKPAVETLTEMLQSCLSEIARSSQTYCELSGRTELLPGDVFMALIEMGINVESLDGYIKRSSRIALPSPNIMPRASTPKILQAGEKKSLPSYIPEYFPAFPDPHAYIRTSTHKQPVTEYEAIREKAASQKRDVERALTRFVAKTGATQSLFTDDTSLFPLIACKPMSHPYLCALLPKDQIFDEEPEEKEEKKSRDADKQKTSAENRTESGSDTDLVDNPYLRSVKMPRKRRR